MGNGQATPKPPQPQAPPPPPPPPPPLFDYPPLAARTRMLESSYNLLFGKLAMKCLFEDYFEEAMRFRAKIMLKPVDDANVDLIASVSGPLDNKPEGKMAGHAQIRWQSNVDDPHTFADFSVSNTEPILLMRSSAYHAKYGFGAFGIFPLLMQERSCSEDYGVMGLRYSSSNLSVGVTFVPLFSGDELPKSAWLVSQMGRFTAGVQFEPNVGSKKGAKYKNPENWSCAVGYGSGSGSSLSPSFNFGFELAKNSQFIASFYHHVAVQRQVQTLTPRKGNVVGITDYIDIGIELLTRVDDKKAAKEPSFQVAASWQANKDFLLKGKLGPLSSSIVLAFKSWCDPSFTFSMSVVRDRTRGNTAFGFGVRVDNITGASCQRADPNFVMLRPNKEHEGERIHWKTGKKLVLQSQVDSGNVDGIPKELRPLHNIL